MRIINCRLPTLHVQHVENVYIRFLCNAKLVQRRTEKKRIAARDSHYWTMAYNKMMAQARVRMYTQSVQSHKLYVNEIFHDHTITWWRKNCVNFFCLCLHASRIVVSDWCVCVCVCTLRCATYVAGKIDNNLCSSKCNYNSAKAISSISLPLSLSLCIICTTVYASMAMINNFDWNACAHSEFQQFLQISSQIEHLHHTHASHTSDTQIDDDCMHACEYDAACGY